MAVPTYDSWSAGEKVTGAKMNKNIRDNGNFLRKPPIAAVYGAEDTSNYSGVYREVRWLTARVNNAGIWEATAPTKFIIPEDGVYECAGNVWIEPEVSNTLDWVQCHWALNGNDVNTDRFGAATFEAGDNQGANRWAGTASILLPMYEGDSLSFYWYSTASAHLRNFNGSPNANVRWVSVL